MTGYRQSSCILVSAALIATPCRAGDLEDGVRFHERNDYAKAIGAFQRAAAKGEAEMGVAQDDGRAAGWYRKAAEQGDRWAQFNASVMYYKGRGVPQDRVEAAKWWTLAMMEGGAYAETIRPSVESAERKLTAEEIAEGKRRAATWTQRSIVNLDKPGMLEAIEKQNPAHHRKILEILRVAQAEPCETLPRILKTQFDAASAECRSYQLLTSDPPKRHLAFTLADTVYVTNVVQYKLRGKLTPAESKK